MHPGSPASWLAREVSVCSSVKGLETPPGKSDKIMTLSSGSEDVLAEGKLGLMLKDKQCELWSSTRVGVGVWGMDFGVRRYIT